MSKHSEHKMARTLSFCKILTCRQFCLLVAFSGVTCLLYFITGMRFSRNNLVSSELGRHLPMNNVKTSLQLRKNNLTQLEEEWQHSKNTLNTTKVVPKLRVTITHEMGRLGNKMFEYASLLGIARASGRHAFVRPYSYNVDMQKVFHLTHVEPYNESRLSSWKRVSETMYAKFDPVFQKLPPEDVIINGYVQSWKYFDKIQDTIRQEFTFRTDIRKEVAKIQTKIKQNYNMNHSLVFIGVHVRRPDTDNSNTTVAPKSFFLNAFQKMKSLLPGKNVVFVVVGNDLNWCHTNLQGSGVVILDPAPAEIHFAVLASCDHVIVSCGTYGWWAAWLANGHVVFYKKFPRPISFEYEGFVYEDYYPEYWIPGDD